MSENDKLIRLMELQKQQLETLLHNSMGKYDQRKIEALESEIEGIGTRIKRHRGEL